MKKLCLALFLLLSSTVAYATDWTLAEDMVKMREEIIKTGDIPVFFKVHCDDKMVSDRLTSLMASDLRKKDNVKIVYAKKEAYLWLQILALRPDESGRVALSFICGETDVAYRIFSEFGIDPKEFMIHWDWGDTSLSGARRTALYASPINSLGDITSQIADAFDVSCLEFAREKRERYMKDGGQSKWEGQL